MQNESSLEHIAGNIERITYYNDQTGFCVVRIKTKKSQDLVTIVGTSAELYTGLWLEASGNWVHDKNHGLQFKASHITSSHPASLEGIQKYLSSGFIKGIGPHFAKILVATFGDQVFQIFDEDPDKLCSVSGIGEKRKNIIIEAWATQKKIRAIMLFLVENGVGSARAWRIYKTYGDNSIELIRENPYRLAADIYGIGFKTADQLALHLGIEKNASVRAKAGLHYTLQKIGEAGHTACEKKHLLEEASQLLEIESVYLEPALADETQEGKLIEEKEDETSLIFLPALYHSEINIARCFATLSKGHPPWHPILCDKAIEWAQEKTNIELSSSQKQAVLLSLQNKVSVITGGPGVGKTTIIQLICKIVHQKKCRILLAAPTGRAAKRLSESTRREAKTIHRLLEYRPQQHTFRYNASEPLPVDLLILDETSMLDVVLMQHVLKAIPPSAGLILVGDIDQLPSIGPGAVLQDVISSLSIPTTRLTEIFRQSKHSQIVINAHRINAGEFPIQTEEAQDFFWMSYQDEQTIYDKLLTVVTERIPKKFGYHPIHDLQVLTPMQRGLLGARQLNIALQAIINPDKTNTPSVSRFGFTYRPCDKVMQIVNNYDKEVFNGDIGTIASLDLEKGSLVIQFDDRSIDYLFEELDEITLAYAVSIHKSQGSEYQAVVIPLAMQHYTMLTRNLLYTGLTRGKKLVVLIAHPKALAIAIKNYKRLVRTTRLKKRILDAFKNRSASSGIFN